MSVKVTAQSNKKSKNRVTVKGTERTEERTVMCREIIGLSGTRAWREASNACASVCVSHERVLFSDKYIVLISVCGDGCLCVPSPCETQFVCETHSEMTESQSILPLRFVSQSTFDPPADERTHTHTHTHNPRRPTLGRRTQGRGMRGERQGEG